MLLDAEYSLFDGIFADKRLDKRMASLLQSMVARESVVINRCFSNKTDKVGAYRMINNQKWDIDPLIKRLHENCVEHIHSSHVLCIQDTSEFNYSNLIGRLEDDDPDIGPVTKNSNTGFFCHPTLVVDAESQVPLGFSHIHLWNRSKDKSDKHERKYQRQKIEDKESYRWIQSAAESSANLPQEIIKTVITDREGDIYQALCKIPQCGCELLIRSSSNRKISEEDTYLLEKMQSLPCKHTYDLRIKGNHSRKNRTALMELRYGSVTFPRPVQVSCDYPDCITINCIYVVEKGNTTPVNELPIEWRLLTTHPVETVEDAMQCVEWYKLRWYIEEVFRLLKSKGLEVESAQLETGNALKKILVLGLVVALQIMQLKLAYDKRDEQSPANVTFTDDQVLLLKILLGMVEGRTARQKNPFREYSIAWAAWIIARLGGWDGYASQDPPGYITFRKGVERLQEHWKLYKVMKDV